MILRWNFQPIRKIEDGNYFYRYIGKELLKDK